MNQELRELLAIARIDGGNGAAVTGSDWSRIVLLKNWGGIPPLRRLANTYLESCGFNFLLLGPDGAPTHFCKCRPATSMALQHEIAVLAALSHDAELSRAVPKTWGVRSGGLQLLISAYVPGTPFDHTVARLSAGQWAGTMSQILAVTRRVAQRAAETLPNLLGRGEPIGLREAARGSLAYLESVGLGRGSLRSLETALGAGGTLHGSPQHGDLWPSNVVHSGGSWWLLDFEVFGEVQVPLYDVCHFVRTCSDLRYGAGRRATAGRWIDRLMAGGAESEACRGTIAAVARQHALGPREVVGALAYYLIDVATQFHKRGGPRWYWEPHVLEVKRLAEVLGAGVDLERLL